MYINYIYIYIHVQTPTCNDTMYCLYSNMDIQIDIYDSIYRSGIFMWIAIVNNVMTTANNMHNQLVKYKYFEGWS